MIIRETIEDGTVFVREDGPEVRRPYELRGQADVQPVFVPEGLPGPPNVLNIGTVKTGSSSSATITGTPPSQVLNLTLERGATGPPNTLTIGTVVDGGEADATITGDAPNQVLNLVLPEGPRGPQGPQGVADLRGDDDSILMHEPLLFPIDERTLTLIRDGAGNLVEVEETFGSVLVKKTTLSRSGGQLSTVTEEAGGKTMVTTLNRTGGVLTSVTRSEQ